jgi:hypothetical protein
LPRDLADVLHYFLPELEETPDADPTDTPRVDREDAFPSQPVEVPIDEPPATTARSGRSASRNDATTGPAAGPPLPVLGLPIGDRDVVRAALAWNLAVETARIAASTILLAPDTDRGSPLWPEPGVGPLGCELLFCPARDLASLYETASKLAARMATDARRGGIVFVRIPPDWLVEGDAPVEPIRWLLLLAGARARDLDEAASLARTLYARHSVLELGVTLHGVASIGEARQAYDALARRTEAESARQLISYGLLVDDLHVYRAIAAQRPVGLAHPQSPAARALMDVARLLYEDARSRVLG